MRLSPVAALLLVVVAGSCSDEFTATERQTVGIRPVAAFPDSLPHADSASLRVEVFSSTSDHPIAGAAVHWTSSDTAVIRLAPGLVDSMHTVAYALSAGTATLTATIVAGTGSAERLVYSHALRVPERWIAVAAGGLQTCALNVDSLAFCWGKEGYLGNGTLAGSSAPVAVLGVVGTRGKLISSGAYATCMLEKNGLIYCWGPNVHGEIGDGSVEPRYLPTIGGAGRIYRHVSVGGDHTCANLQTLEEGAVMCWGLLELGQAGINMVPGSVQGCVYTMEFPNLRAMRHCNPAPTNPVEGPTHTPLNAPVFAGGSHACVVDDGRQVAPAGWLWCWGLGSTGQVGAPMNFSRSCPGSAVGGGGAGGVDTALRCFDMARRVVGMPGLMATVSPGWSDDGSHPTTDNIEYVSHTCGLTVDSLAYCWGAGHYYQLGTMQVDSIQCPVYPDFSAVTCSRSAKAVQTSLRFTAIGAGARHSCGIAVDSLVYCWGENSRKQLGDLGSIPRVTVERVLTPPTERFVSLSVGAWHSCAIAARTGALYCWGKNDSGQGGSGALSPTIPPTRVKEPN